MIVNWINPPILTNRGDHENYPKDGLFVLIYF
jgi:hypothetical protein